MQKNLHIWKKSCTFAVDLLKITLMKLGDNVFISPDLTRLSNWIQGNIIDVENNPYNGTVISAKTSDGNIFFGVANLFRPIA